jgi:glycerophosphoryl diester phosphodiesterase
MSQDHFDKEGHRGCRGLMPENTIPAMLKAIDLGVNTLEMDVVISADKKVVVSHDPYFNEKITTAPGGRYLTHAEAQKLLLYHMPYDSIRRYDVGLKPYPEFPKQERIAVSKPLLADLLKETETYAKKNGQTIHYNIEIKSTPTGDGINHPPVDEFVKLVMDVVNDGGAADRTIIQSFDPRPLQLIHRQYHIDLSLLVEGSIKMSFEDQLKLLGFIPDVYSPHYSLVTPALVQQCHDKKMKLVPWTVNNIDDIRRLKEMGVDGIITDYPDLFSKL